MSPVIYREEPQSPQHKKCKYPVSTKIRGYGEADTKAPAEPIGTIWECDICEKRYVSYRETLFFYPRWKLIKPWHFGLQKKIRGTLEADNLN